MTQKKKLLIYFFSLSLFAGFIYAIRTVLSPFILAFVIAYFLSPLVDKLKKFGFSRALSTSLILLTFLALTCLVLVLVLPLLYGQVAKLITSIPSYFEIITSDIYPKIYQYTSRYGINLEPDLHNYLTNQNIQENFSNVFGFSGTLIQNLMSSGVFVVNIISFTFITPVLVFYILRDWNLLMTRIKQYFPAKHNLGIVNLFKEIDKTLFGYVRGQFNVCLILGLFYGLSLNFSGLNFGFLIGFLTGFLSFIPYLGMICGVVSAIIVAFFQFGFNPLNIGLISLIFLIGQIIESNFLTPKLIGDKIGLHAVWIIFGLFAFAALFGFYGVLLAMPATAISGVIIKLAAKKFQKHLL